MQTSDKGVELIKSFEALRLKAYLDAVGVWTIGYGHTIGVKAGDVITEEVANHMLGADLCDPEDAINNNAKVPLNQNQFDALVSLTFNIGNWNFKKSTLLRELNSGEYEEAARQFLVWDKGHVNGKLVPLPGLTKRRAAESALFNTSIEMQ
jgi:lysozyme